ncbi:immunoglobulin-like domain-containing protein [Agarivorans gilvus]|uniref:Pesticidal crystal protein Cry22Aa Ig-like domain-containing protein n=1 Tax=Agarivorans gilvus TaxID=680279 RepID=A0ABQ1I6T2_9ALTE|nr:immunoglobulin-like domain-containing protein [Agarivorans gilvus]GGB22105.1 hypothetical protein GCM10007414_39370 [Agarivorans gilvus]
MKKIGALLVSTSLLISGCGGGGGDDTSNNSGEDTTAPSIALVGAQSINIEVGSNYTDAGANATDNVDTTVNVLSSGTVDTSTLGSYTITYSATDAAGNTSTATRTIAVVDTTAPVITLTGNANVSLLAGESYTDAGASATDAYEGSITVSTNGSVDASTAGTYTLTYSAADTSGNSSELTRTVLVMPSSMLSIQTSDYFDGEAIEGVEVTVNSIQNGTRVTRSGVTDSNGEATIIVSSDAERVVISSDIAGYGEYSSVTTATDQTVFMFLQPINANLTFTPTQTANLNVAGLNVVDLAPNSLVDENGNPASAELSAAITVIDPSVDPDLMPGNFETIDTANNQVSQIESFGAISVTFSDSEGNDYNLATGQTATIRIPLASDANSAPDTIPLYYFDEDSGYWVEEGSASLVTNDGTPYYLGSVEHFTTWNADQIYQSVQITGCVEDSDGNPITSARIITQGASYSGQANATTDSTGRFSVAAKSSSTVYLQANTSGSNGRTLTLTTGTSDLDLGECLSLEEASATVTLSWGENPRDLDTQFFGPESATGDTAFLVYFANKQVTLENSSIWLDVDDVNSYGPEITTIGSFPYAGRYSYAVKHYAGTSDIAASPSRVELNYAGRTQVFSPPAGEPTVCWAVFDFVVDANGGVTIEPTGTWESNAYCSAREYNTPSATSMSRSSKVASKGILQEQIDKKYYAK